MSKKNKKFKKIHNTSEVKPDIPQPTREVQMTENTLTVHESNPIVSLETTSSKQSPSTPSLKIPDQGETKNRGVSKFYSDEFTSKIYDKKRRMNKNQSRSFFGSIADVVFADVVWQSVAISLLAGIAIFYFFGIQPLVLVNYADQAKSQISEIKTNYTIQTNSFKNLQSELFAQLRPVDLGEKCFASQGSPFSADSFSKIDTLQRQNLPALKLTQLADYNSFSEPSIKTTYSNIYSKYEDSLASYNTAIKELREAISFLNWRSRWVNACTNISSSSVNLETLASECNELAETTKDLETNQNRFFSSSAAVIQKGLDLCKEVTTYQEANPNQTAFPNFNRWQIQWLGELENIIKIPVNVGNTVEKLQNTDSNLISELNQAGTKIDNVVSSKSELANHFYLLDLSL